MTSPFIPNSFTYGDSPAGGLVMPMVIAGRDPSDTIDTQYPSGYLWLSDLFQGGTGTLFYQAGNSAGVPAWTSVGGGAGGALNTLSNGSTQVSPSAGNIALEGTASQIIATSNAPAHNITFSLSPILSLPGTLTVPGLITGNGGLDISSGGASITGVLTTITGNFAVTGDSTFTGDLTVTGNLVTGGITENGNVGINTSGAGTTTIGNAAAGLIKFDVGTGNFALNGGGNTIDLGADAAANTITLGNITTTTSVHIQSGTGDIKIDGADTATITLGTATQTGTITIGQSTAGENIDIGSGINAVAQVITIGNGASAADSTVDILSGIGTAGVGVLALGNNTRVTTIGMGNVAPAAARVITIAGGNSAQNDTVTIFGGAPSANTQTFNLFSGNASGGTQVINMGTGTNAMALNIGTGTTGVKTIAIGGTAANVITLGNTQTAGSVAIGNSMTTGTVTIGGANQTGTITLGNATNATGQIVNVLSGLSIAGPNILHLLDGATPGGTQTLSVLAGVTSGAFTQSAAFLGGANTQGTQNFQVLNGVIAGGTGTVSILSGAIASGTETFNLFNGNATGGTLVANIFGSVAATTAGTVNIGTGAAAHVTNIGSSTGGAVTIRSGSGNTIGIGVGGNASQLITIGATNQAGTISIGTSTAGITVNLMDGVAASAQILNIASGISSTGDQTVNLLNGTTPAGNTTLSIMNAAGAGTKAFSLLSTGATTAGTYNIGDGAAAHVGIIGSTTASASLTLHAGTGATGIKLDAAGNVQMVPATSSTASPTAAATMNNRVGKATFTGFTTAAAGTQGYTITNSTILATSCVLVTVANLNASAQGAEIGILGVTQAAGSIVVNTKNNGGGALGAGDDVHINFWILS